MQAVILAAGKGTRLRPMTDTMPKGMVDVCGRPLIKRIIDVLPSSVSSLVIVVGYRGEQIIEYVKANVWRTPVTFVTQERLDGTGTALYLAREFLHDRFLVINGDDLYDGADLERLIRHDLAVLVKQTDVRPPSSVALNPDGSMNAISSSTETGPWLQVCGAYQLDQRFFDIPLVDVAVRDSREYSLPHTIARLARLHPVAVERATHWIPVGTPTELELARKICA